MSQKVEKPVLNGQRIKTRKRDEKEKYDPTLFRDAVFATLAEAKDLDQVPRNLDIAKLDYRRYGETLFDILFTGGILAPGGAVIDDGDTNRASKTNVCVFEQENNLDSLKAFTLIFKHLIVRYKYLVRVFDDEMEKVLTYTKGFEPDSRDKLSKITAIFLMQSPPMVAPTVLSALFQDHLVKDGVALNFFTTLLKTLLTEKEAAAVWAILKKAGVESRLLDLMPSTHRTQDHFRDHFNEAGLEQVVQFTQNQQLQAVKKELVTSLSKLVNEGDPVKEIVQHVKEQQEKLQLPEHELVVLIWTTLMGTVEWNKKEDLVADQALRHLKIYAPLLATLTTSDKSERALMLKVQEYCYDNMVFQRVFQKIVLLFYNQDVLSEDTILKWYRESSNNTKGKNHFLDQMKKMVEWLESAEEEEGDDSGEEEEDD